VPRVLGFFSFTEVTDPSAHQAYNDWHRLDHMPEQFSLDGVLFGQRWVCTPACRRLRVAVSPRLEPCHYMTLYLMRDADVVPPFFALARRLRQADRFFAERLSHLSGPFEVQDRWVSPRVKVSEAVVPFRPAIGIYVVVGPPVEGAAMVGLEGVAGAWSFSASADATASTTTPATTASTTTDSTRHITVAFIDGDLVPTAQTLGRWCLEADPSTSPTTDPRRDHILEWAGPLERLDTDSAGWFDRLTPQ
jgi:hypothetical protein